MKINPIPTQHFKANYYKIQNYGKYSSVYIMTDNAEQLGENPVYESKYDDIRMLFDGKYYTTEYPVPCETYRIKYLDTGKYENQGKENTFIYPKLTALVERQKVSKNLTLSKGSAKGQLISTKNITDELLNSKTPLIIVCDNGEECYKYFDRADGMILKSAPAELLSHFAALTRDKFSFASLVVEEKALKDLGKLEGEFVSISNEGEDIKFEPIASLVNLRKNCKQIEIPLMRRVDSILSLDECEKDTVGNKAYNLKRMMNLVKEGKLSDVIIPNAFVLPYGYLERVENSIAENPENYFDKNNEILKEIKDFANNVITQKYVVVRSAFNGEDLEGYSAAGLYDSRLALFRDLTLHQINKIVQSKDNLIAVKSREQHNIKEKDIKPSVIIQDYIFSDYKFTAYTESPLDKDKMFIELYINKDRQCSPTPYHITYDKISNKFEVEQEHSLLTEYVFDEGYKLLSKTVKDEHHLDKIWNVLENLVKNALVLEKAFGKPQDIEGGIKAGQLYLWQTRNIVKHCHL